jgi:hypothetical protein
MTNGDIVKSYKEAKEKKKQIEILAQLNACPVTTIKEILVSEGVQFPGPKTKKPESPTAETPAEAPKENKIPGAVIAAVTQKITALEEEIERLNNTAAVLKNWLKKTK